MADDFVVVGIDGLKEIQAKLAKLPDTVADMGVDAANEYLLKVLQAYPPKNYVTRKAAYGQSFFTVKQRRWFFASLNDGSLKVPYSRTQGIRKGWQVEGSGRKAFLSNSAPGIQWVMGDDQARQPALVGWKKASAILKERTSKIVEAFDIAIKKAIRKVGLG